MVTSHYHLSFVMSHDFLFFTLFLPSFTSLLLCPTTSMFFTLFLLSFTSLHTSKHQTNHHCAPPQLALTTSPSSLSDSPTSPSHPAPPPPPPPLNIPPSRARRQLAARLAMNKKKKEEDDRRRLRKHARTGSNPGSSASSFGIGPMEGEDAEEADVEWGVSRLDGAGDIQVFR